MVATASICTFFREELEDKISKRPGDLRPLDYLAACILEAALDPLRVGGVAQDKKDEIQQAIAAFKIPSADHIAYAGEASIVANMYDRLRNLGGLIGPPLLRAGIKYAVLRAIVPTDIESEQEMKMRYELLCIYGYLTEKSSFDDAFLVIEQIMNAHIDNYQGAIDACFDILKVEKPEVYPDLYYFQLYKFGQLIQAFTQRDPLRGFFEMLWKIKKNEGPQILVCMLPGGSNYDKFNQSFAQFVKSGEFFKYYPQEWLFIGRSYKDRVVLSSFMTKLEQDLGFTSEGLFMQMCSSTTEFKDCGESIDLVKNYNDPLYGALVSALLHKPALLDEVGKNVGNFLPIEETDIIGLNNLSHLLGWMQSMNYIVYKYKELHELIETGKKPQALKEFIGKKDQALKEFIEYVKTDAFRYKALKEGGTTNPFWCEDLPLPDGFKNRYCTPTPIVPKTNPDEVKNHRGGAIILCIVTGAIALLCYILFRDPKLSTVAAAQSNARNITSILK